MPDKSPETPRQTEILNTVRVLHDAAYFHYLALRNLCYDIRDGQYMGAAETAKHLNLNKTQPEFYATLQSLAQQSSKP